MGIEESILTIWGISAFLTVLFSYMSHKKFNDTISAELIVYGFVPIIGSMAAGILIYSYFSDLYEVKKSRNNESKGFFDEDIFKIKIDDKVIEVKEQELFSEESTNH